MHELQKEVTWEQLKARRDSLDRAEDALYRAEEEGVVGEADVQLRFKYPGGGWAVQCPHDSYDGLVQVIVRIQRTLPVRIVRNVTAESS